MILLPSLPPRPPAVEPADTILIEARRVLPSVGLMNDHMREAGEFMIACVAMTD